ncbi:MAG TPA: GNAT family N-acetyltransferase [Allosphingosinicella sp.]|nr:GNAT family N-acetyltransferase [Allosphingosinicella sp.]
MRQENNSIYTAQGLWRGCFSAKIERCIERAGAPITLDRAGWGEVRDMIARAARTMSLAPEAAVRRIWEKNPDVFRVVRQSAQAPANGLIALLPLNARGAEAIATGRFDGSRPDPELIAGLGETPHALYFWLVFAPGKLANMLAAIAEVLRDFAASGCAIFSRAVDARSVRLHDTIGFRVAREFFPEAPEWLLVTFPEHAPPPKKPPRQIEVRLVRSFEDMAKIFSVRASTYLAEQFCLYDEEFDGNDFCASQFLGSVDGDPAGCIRLRYFGGFAKIERLAVRKEYRRTALAFELVRASLRHSRRKNFTQVYGHSRRDLLPFWGRFGLRPIEGRPVFKFANLEYVEIAANLEEDPEAIRFGADPMVAIRPEGAWDRPGPLDLSNLSVDPERVALLRSHTRMLGAR